MVEKLFFVFYIRMRQGMIGQEDEEDKGILAFTQTLCRSYGLDLLVLEV